MKRIDRLIKKNKKQAKVFKGLANETRISILRILKGRVLCVKVLAKELNMTSPAVSQHLRILENLGAVIPEKQGNYVHYKVNQETLNSWLKMIQEITAETIPVGIDSKNQCKSENCDCGTHARMSDIEA